VTISPQLVFRLSFREEDFGVANLVRVAVRHDDGEPIAEVSSSVTYQPPAGKELSFTRSSFTSFRCRFDETACTS